MKDPIKIIHKFKNNNRRIQYKVYIYVGYLVPKEIMTILNFIINKIKNYWFIIINRV